MNDINIIDVKFLDFGNQMNNIGRILGTLRNSETKNCSNNFKIKMLTNCRFASI